GAVCVCWVGVRWRVVPRLSANWGVVAVGCTAVVLFAAGIHWVGWRSYRTAGEKWRLRWTLAAVMMVFVLFAAGVAFIGVVHQTGWLLTSEEPLTGTTLDSPWGARSRTNMQYMGMAYGNAVSAYGSLGDGRVSRSDGAVQHSWETYLLPYIAFDTQAVDFKRPWNDPVNEKNFKSVLWVFINPEFRTVDVVDAKGYG